MRRPLFASLLDTARIEAREKASAKTILMLSALSASSCELATIHAINSKLLLDDCTYSEDFLHLVRLGRIRFRILPDGKGPREELARRLDFERYLGAWPEIYEDPTSFPGKLIPEYTRPAQEFLLDRKPLSSPCKVTGNDNLDRRLNRARRFFEAIEAAHESNAPESEVSRKDEFERLVMLIPDSAARHGEDQRLLSMFKTILRDERSSRAKLWEKIDTCSMGTIDADDAERLRARAKVWVNRANDSAIAYSLESRLLSCDSEVALGPELQQSASTRRAEIHARPLSPGQVRDLARFGIDWKHVHVALEPAGARDGDLEDAFGRLSSMLGAFDLKESKVKKMAGLFAPLAALAAVVPAPDAGGQGHLVELQGALGGHMILFGAVSALLWTMTEAAGVKAVQQSVNEFVIAQKTERERSKLTKMRGWLDLE